MKKKLFNAVLMACCVLDSQAIGAAYALPTCAEHHQSDWAAKLFIPAQDFNLVLLYNRGFYDKSDSFSWYSLEKKADRLELKKHDYQRGAPSAVETLIAVETEMNQVAADIFAEHVHMDTSGYREHIHYTALDFFAQDCSGDKLAQPLYASSMQAISKLEEQQELYLTQDDFYPSSTPPVSLDGSQCLDSEVSYLFNTVLYDFASNQNQTTQLYFIGHCQSQPALIFVHKVSADGQQQPLARYAVPASLTSFVELDGTKGQYLNLIAGISDSGDTVAVNLIEYNHKAFLLGTLEVIVIKDGQTHRLPMQKTLNTEGALSDAKLSYDGHRIIIAHGTSIKLYEYDSSSNTFVYRAQHSLASLYPSFYQEGSLRISEDGMTASFQVYSPDHNTQSYQVTFH